MSRRSASWYGDVLREPIHCDELALFMARAAVVIGEPVQSVRLSLDGMKPGTVHVTASKRGHVDPFAPAPISPISVSHA